MINGFNKSLAELSHYGDSFKLREKQLKQNYTKKFNKQKKEFNDLLEIEKKRYEQLQSTNNKLAEQIDDGTIKQIDLQEMNTVLNTKYNSCLEELNQFVDKYNKNNRQIQQLEENITSLKEEQANLSAQVLELKTENRTLIDKISRKSVPNEISKLAEKAVSENEELRKGLIERDTEILRLNEQLNKIPNETSEHLLQVISKLKKDFQIMFDAQSTFFRQHITLLQQEQHKNLSNLYQQ